MDLISSVQLVVQNLLKNASLTDLSMGTVTTLSPLTITVESSRLPIPSGALLLTQSVIEKKIVSSSPCIENGKPLPIDGEYAVVNKGLNVGDKVLMLRVSSGQRYIVLSRIFEEG